MELNEVQQTFFEKLKLLLVSNNKNANIAKAKDIFNATLNNAKTPQEQAYIQESLEPILQEFIRHLNEDVETPDTTAQDAQQLVEDGEIAANSNLTGYVNIRDENGKIQRQLLDVEDDLTSIGNAVSAAMKNFSKGFQEDEMDPDIAEYLASKGK